MVSLNLRSSRKSTKKRIKRAKKKKTKKNKQKTFLIAKTLGIAKNKKAFRN